MSFVPIDKSLIRALQARARKQRITVDRLVKRLIVDGLQELDDHEAVKAIRARGARAGARDVRGLKGMLGRPPKPVTLQDMRRAVMRRAGR